MREKLRQSRLRRHRRRLRHGREERARAKTSMAAGARQSARAQRGKRERERLLPASRASAVARSEKEGRVPRRATTPTVGSARQKGRLTNARLGEGGGRVGRPHISVSSAWLWRRGKERGKHHEYAYKKEHQENDTEQTEGVEEQLDYSSLLV